MFEFLERKKLPFDEISEALLDTANAIIQAASGDSTLEVAMQGMAAVIPFVTEIKKRYGLSMDPDSTFTRYIKFCVEPENISAMADDTRGQARTLLGCKSDGAKASFIYMWYTGEHPEHSAVKEKLMLQNSLSKGASKPNSGGHQSFESWLQEFKTGAASVNELLSESNGKNLIDFMDHTPLRRAFADGVDPRQLGVGFGQQFDFAKFLASMQS